jgi:hypothetical protein
MSDLNREKADSNAGSAKTLLSELLAVDSKHSTYQELHPLILDFLGKDISPAGKRESLRWDYMGSLSECANKTVIDIGANTGYFSFASIAQGAASVEAYEGNQQHAEFLRECATVLGMESRLAVFNAYYDFGLQSESKADIALCLNVLHHLGDDFGSKDQSMEMAKSQMVEKLHNLARHAGICWFQLGFNWQGDPARPLFPNGFKSELIEFVRQACDGAWLIEDIGIFNPVNECYEPFKKELLERFDEAGEFLNRPIFLLKSLHFHGMDED